MTYVHPRLRPLPSQASTVRRGPKKAEDQTSLHTNSPLAEATIRAEIATLEMEWTAEAEAAAARSLGRSHALGDREKWDRTTWQRYLAAAVECETHYLPRLRLLYALQTATTDEPIVPSATTKTDVQEHRILEDTAS